MRLLDAGLPFEMVGRLGVAQLDGWVDTAEAFKIEKQLTQYQAVAAAMAGKGATRFLNSIIMQKESLLGGNPYAPTAAAIAATKRKLAGEAKNRMDHMKLVKSK